MESELSGQCIGGWQLMKCVGFGKSALVFRASRGAEVAAVKVFDREIVERFAKASQRTRVVHRYFKAHHPSDTCASRCNSGKSLYVYKRMQPECCFHNLCRLPWRNRVAANRTPSSHAIPSLRTSAVACRSGHELRQGMFPDARTLSCRGWSSRAHGVRIHAESHRSRAG